MGHTTFQELLINGLRMKTYKSILSMIWNMPTSLWLKLQVTWRIFIKRIKEGV